MNKTELLAEEKKLEQQTIEHGAMVEKFWSEIATRIKEDWVDSGRVCEAPLVVLREYRVLPVKKIEITLTAEVGFNFDVEAFNKRLQRDTIYNLQIALEEEVEETDNITVKVVEV